MNNYFFWLGNFDRLPLWFFVLITALVLLTLVVVHESGHFFVARFFKMQTPVVGLGLPFVPDGLSWSLLKRIKAILLAGNRILKNLKNFRLKEIKKYLILFFRALFSFPVNFKLFSYKEIEFRIHLLLLGAYVAIPEMDDESTDQDFGIKLKESKKSFPAWQKIIVSFAGPGANLLFAFLMAIISVSILGIPQIVENERILIVTKVSSKASNSVRTQVKAGDQIESLNRKKINNIKEFLELRDQTKSKDLELGIYRGKRFQTLKISKNNANKLGINLLEKNRTNQISLSETKEFPIWRNLKYGTLVFLSWSLGLVQNLLEIIKSPFVQNSQIEAKDIHGVFYAAPKIAEIIKEHREAFYRITGLISIELALINLLPIMPLDGGHIFFQLGEILVGKKHKEKLLLFRNYLAQAGLFLILLLTCLVLFNDFRASVFGD